MLWINILPLVAFSPLADSPRKTVETRVIKLTQTVTLDDIQKGSKQIRLWVPIPSDTVGQRVLDRRIVSAPGAWRLERQDEGRGDFVYAEINHPEPGQASVVVECTVERQGFFVPLRESAKGEIQPASFTDSLKGDAPLMEVNDRIRKMADKACGKETDPARQGLLLLQAVAEAADHYSKDPSKPNCGRGAAEDCLEQGGGCCTDLHALFIALARARGIPARMQYGYRTLDAKAGQSYDPGYRCWVEFFVPGAGWVANDIVASDAVDATHPMRWGSLSATRVWLWEGRSFELNPKSAGGPTHTMTCGWAEVDGKTVDVLPSADGKPSKLRRTVKFEVVQTDRKPDATKLPE